MAPISNEVDNSVAVLVVSYSGLLRVFCGNTAAVAFLTSYVNQSAPIPVPPRGVLSFGHYTAP